MKSSNGKFGMAVLAASTLALASHTAMAVDYNVSPANLAGAKAQFAGPHGTGTNPFAYDWDSAAPNTASGAPAGYGDESFSANVNSAGATAADRYRTVRISLQSLFGGPVALEDIAEISYQTNKPDPQTAFDWRMTIYTTPGDKGTDPNDAAVGSGDTASWYRSRIQMLPNQSDSLNAPANQWNTWTTSDTTNQALFYSNKFSGAQTGTIEWSEIVAGNVTRNAITHDFSGESVMMLDFTQGANSGGWTGLSQIDAIRVELVGGEVANINLVPEPSGVALIGLAGAALLRRNRRKS